MVRPTKMDVVVPATVVNPNDNQTYRVTALGDGAFTVYGLRGGAGNVSSLMPDICANFVFTDFTVPGITSDVKLLCPENAFALISSKPSGRTIDV